MSTTTNGGRAHAFQALRESEELHRATLGSISDAVFLSDDAGAFTFICPNVDVIFGYTPDEVRTLGRIGRLLGERLYEPAELETRGEICNIEREVSTKSGQRRVLLIHLKRVSIQGGTVLYTCRDVTELKAAERELAATRAELTHAGRLALAGQLTASIGHEVQQPLSSILINASAGIRLLQEVPESPRVAEIRAILEDIREESSTAAQIIERLRTLVRKRPLELRALDVNGVVRDVLQLVAADARRRGASLHAELTPLPLITGDRVSIQQVTLNLLLNALDAVSETPAGNRVVAVRTRVVGPMAEISVRDTGPGVAAEQLPKIFDAFFSTKRDGVGLGLAITHSIVQAHGGEIRAENHADGATFRVILPLTPPA